MSRSAAAEPMVAPGGIFERDGDCGVDRRAANGLLEPAHGLIEAFARREFQDQTDPAFARDRDISAAAQRGDENERTTDERMRETRLEHGGMREQRR